jgi:flagellar biosynthesis protein FlhF
MVIRSYTAESVATALKQVRREMGGAAVVLKTRVIEDPRGARQYEVTACLDKPTVEQANTLLNNEAAPAAPKVETARTPQLETPMVTSPSVVSSDLDKRLNAIEERLDLLLQAAQLDQSGLTSELTPSARAAEAMQAADVPETFITEFFGSIRRDLPTRPIDDTTIRRRLVDHLDAILDKKLELKPGDRVLVAGPAGAGKTSVIGRLAAQLICRQHIPVKLISLDNHKVGAMEEVAGYADLLGVDDFASVEGGHILSEQDKKKVLLIDTNAMPRDSKHLAELQERIKPLKPTHRLAVFSALMRTSDVDTYAREMDWLKPTHLVFTMTDLTRRLGSLLSATVTTGLKIALLTNSSSPADSVTAPDAEAIAEIILGEEAGRE